MNSLPNYTPNFRNDGRPSYDAMECFARTALYEELRKGEALARTNAPRHELLHRDIRHAHVGANTVAWEFLTMFPTETREVGSPASVATSASGFDSRNLAKTLSQRIRPSPARRYQQES